MAVSVCVCLLAAEFFMRRVIQVGSFRYESSNGKSWNQADPDRIYALTPSFRGLLKAPEFTHAVEINERGLRGPLYSEIKPENTRRVFVAGDSFVFGVGVDEQDSIPGRLRHYLNLDGKAEVWNLGVPGYSPPQYLLTLRKFLFLKPDAVIFCVYADSIPSGANDLSGAVDFEKEQGLNAANAGSFRPGSAAARKPSFSVYAKKWLLRNSALYTFMISRFGPALRATHHQRGLTMQEREIFEKGMQILNSNFSELKNLGAQNGFKVIVAYIASRPDLDNRHDAWGQRLSTVARENGFEFVDGYTLFASQSGLSGLYYPLDGHLKARGYDLLARELAKKL